MKEYTIRRIRKGDSNVYLPNFHDEKLTALEDFLGEAPNYTRRILGILNYDCLIRPIFLSDHWAMVPGVDEITIQSMIPCDEVPVRMKTDEFKELLNQWLSDVEGLEAEEAEKLKKDEERKQKMQEYTIRKIKLGGFKMYTPDFHDEELDALEDFLAIEVPEAADEILGILNDTVNILHPTYIGNQWVMVYDADTITIESRVPNNEVPVKMPLIEFRELVERWIADLERLEAEDKVESHA